MLTVKEAAKRLGISQSKLYQLVSERKIAHYRVGGKIVFAEADLDAYLESCRVEAGGVARAPRRPSGGLFKHLDSQRLAEAWRRQGPSA
jgi:excisionase family DNA binding protein